MANKSYLPVSAYSLSHLADFIYTEGLNRAIPVGGQNFGSPQTDK